MELELVEDELDTVLVEDVLVELAAEDDDCETVELVELDELDELDVLEPPFPLPASAVAGFPALQEAFPRAMIAARMACP
jgi:hypothetical protein